MMKLQKQPQEVFCNNFLEISPNSQEITCARVSFLIKLQALSKFSATVVRKTSYTQKFCKATHLTLTCSKSIIETLEKGVKYVQS